MTVRFTRYFENEVLRKRPYLQKDPYLQKEWCQAIIANPLRSEEQAGGRFRFWGRVEALGGKVLRVVTLADKLTIHNAFPDRDFKP
jgi:hypothetical protein